MSPSALLLVLFLLLGVVAGEVQEEVPTEVQKEAPKRGDLGAIGAGLAVGLAGLGAGLGLGTVGAASVGAIAERPEVFGRTMVFLAFTEAVAIYGLAVAMLLLFG